MWPAVPSSQVPSSSLPSRTTMKAYSSTRSIEGDQLLINFAKYEATFTSLNEGILSTFAIIVPLFLVKMFKDFYFEAYLFEIKCTATTLSKNSVMTVHEWSIFWKNYQILDNKEMYNKIVFLSSILVEWHRQLWGKECIVKN